MLMRLAVDEPEVHLFKSAENRDDVRRLLAERWTDYGTVWCNPPFYALDNVVDKIINEAITAVVIMPTGKEKSSLPRQ